MWLVPEQSIKKVDTGNDAFGECLKSVLRGKGDGWRGMTTGGMIADLEGVETLIAKLDEIFSMSGHTAGESHVKKRKAEGDVVEID